MISLVKHQQGDAKKLIAKNGTIEAQPAGILISFREKDGRKSGHAVLIEKDDVKVLIDELLEFLK